MRPDDLVHAISESSFFHGLPQEERVALSQLGRAYQHAAGEVLFRPRQVPSALYLVLSGVVEICREEDETAGLQPVAYLGAGALLSESKVVTGTALSSLARFPEGGSTFQWPRPILLRKLYGSRDFAMHYLQSLARRLEGTIADLGARRGSNLGGMIDHFDLPTILQTVVDSGATGVLEISDAQGNKFGVVHTRNRMIGPMLCGTLSGPEAFLEILVSPPSRGTFKFSSVATPRETEEHFQLHPLLFDAARIQDEFTRFASEVPGEAVLKPAGRQLEWSDGETRELTNQIWQNLSNQAGGWANLAAVLPFSRGQIGLAVRDMLRAGVLVAEGDYKVSAGTEEDFDIDF
ncbi:MAG: cyclic nucleotide-binding domain-containing protein [Thermoanaerobaculales bacterium]